MNKTVNITVKSSAGHYTRTDGIRFVEVTYFDHLKGWIAAAEWDRHLYTDACQTKREAIFNADHMMSSYATTRE